MRVGKVQHQWDTTILLCLCRYTNLMSNHGDMQNKYFGDCYDIHNVQTQYKGNHLARGVGTSGGALGLVQRPPPMLHQADYSATHSCIHPNHISESLFHIDARCWFVRFIRQRSFELNGRDYSQHVQWRTSKSIAAINTHCNIGTPAKRTHGWLRSLIRDSTRHI